MKRSSLCVISLLPLLACDAGDMRFFGGFVKKIQCRNSMTCTDPLAPRCEDGACMPCRTDDDCGHLAENLRLCQTRTGACEGCRVHDDCPSKVCLTAEIEASEARRGVCVLPSSVAHVGNTSCPDGVTCIRPDQLTELQNPNLAYVRIFSTDEAKLAPITITRAAGAPPLVLFSDKDVPPTMGAIAVNSGKLTLSNLSIRADSKSNSISVRSMNRAAVACGSAAQLVVRKGVIASAAVGDMPDLGIYADNGCSLTVDRTLIYRFGGGCISHDNLDGFFQITNTLSAFCSESVDQYAIILSGSNESPLFAYNTVYSPGKGRGIKCNSTLNLANSVISVNKAGDQQLNCVWTSCGTLSGNLLGCDPRDTAEACRGTLRGNVFTPAATMVQCGTREECKHDYFGSPREDVPSACGFARPPAGGM